MKNKLDIIFEDNNLMVINKPSGLIVHEGTKTKTTLVDLIAKYIPTSKLKDERYGIVHRLDKDTSGIILVAKTKIYFEYLKKLFKDRKIKKEYLALIHGKLAPKKGVIKIPLARGLVNKTKFEPSATGRFAETKYEVIEYKSDYTYLRAYPKTGRTHQIRVHFASLGYPVVGDTTYGKKDMAPRMFLHSHQISFKDMDGKECRFTVDLPEDLNNFLKSLK